jgi:thiamine transport system permease protein
LLTLLLLMVVCLAYEFSRWRRLLLSYMPPGAVLVGFAYFILEPILRLPLALQLILGLGIVFFASLLRLSVAGTLSGLLPQIEVAEVLGASPTMVFQRVLLPPLIKPLMFTAGMASMWASGEFALSSILSSEDFHLALVIKSWASSYRLEAAQALMFLLYLVALVCFYFWWRLGDVLSRKLTR